MLLDIHTHHPVDGSILSIDLASSVVRPSKGYCSIGIHPWTASKTTTETWTALEEAVCHPNVLAIGEAGLDKLAATDWNIQQETFIRQIRLSEAVGKPLIIHCVKAFNEVIRLKKEIKPCQPWIIHGFRNNLNIARQLMNEDIHLSLGEKYQTEVLMNIPLERLLVETDESTLPIRDIIAHMAEARGMEADELIKKLTENVQNIFFRR